LGEDKPWERQVSEPVSKSLKTGTKMVHRSAENFHFVRDFLKGSVKKDSYIELLRALYHVYSTMEIALMDLPRHLRHCDFSVLERASALEEDLRYYLGTPDGEAVDFGKPSPAAQQYVDQLELMAKEDPLMLLAHAYTRYLGDLSGGQILARSATKAYGLPEGRGTSFYKFDLVGSTAAELKAFKKAYRSSLDALQISSKRADALVQEANKAFLMNILLFEERDVAAGHLDRIRTLDEVSKLIETNMTPLAFQRAYGTTQTSGVVSQCPFIPGMTIVPGMTTMTAISGVPPADGMPLCPATPPAVGMPSSPGTTGVTSMSKHLARVWGKAGGDKAARALTPEQRSRRASLGGAARAKKRALSSPSKLS